MGNYTRMRYKTKRRVRDLDLIFNDLATPESIEKLKHQPLDETKPGLGQYYCIHCAKYCETRAALQTHFKAKVHKRRVKDLNVRPYTQEESDAASGTNLQLFMEKVEIYKKRDLERKILEGNLLGAKQLEELKLKDELNEIKLTQSTETTNDDTVKPIAMQGEIEMQT